MFLEGVVGELSREFILRKGNLEYGVENVNFNLKDFKFFVKWERSIGIFWGFFEIFFGGLVVFSLSW